MNIDWPPNPQEALTGIVILGTVFSFCVSHYPLSPANLETFFQDKEKSFYASKIFSGVLWIGTVLVLSLYSGTSMSYFCPSWLDLFYGIGIGVAVFVLLLPSFYLTAKKTEMQVHYPELRVRVRSPQLIRNSAICWFVYLTGYELLFRGLLLHYGIESWGFWNGMFLMTGLYVLAHLHKDSSETFACFIAGPLFGFLTLWSGSIWTAVILHTLIAVVTENLAARYNPDFRSSN